MSKDPVNLDFSEISKTKTVATPPPPAPEVKPPQAEAQKPLGISIALEPQPGKFILKDLAELTGEEFLMWATKVFPVLDQKSANARDFDGRSQKASAFEQILKFHIGSIFHVKKELNWTKPH